MSQRRGAETLTRAFVAGATEVGLRDHHFNLLRMRRRLASVYRGSASVQFTGGRSGVFQPQDEAESRNSRQPAEEATQRADHERRQATGALRRDRGSPRGWEAAAAVQVREQGDLRPARRTRVQLAA